MQTVPQGYRLRTWLIASIALHLLLVLLLLTHRMLQESQIAKVIFDQPGQKQLTQVQAPPMPVPQPIPQQTPPPAQKQDSETIDFNLDLHKTTKFGHGDHAQEGPELPKERMEPDATAIKGNIPGTATQHVAKKKLARLFEGFLDYMSDPRREEMIDYHAPDKRYADYMRKVGWALQNSFQLHNKPLTLEQDVHTQITLVLEIGRDGRLMALSMAPFTSEEMLNKHITKIVNKAAPFARLPDDFKRTCMKIKLPVYIDAQQGTHTYYLQF